MKTTHLPPINDWLEELDFPWEVNRADGDERLFRAVTYQNLDFATVEKIVITALRRAYRLEGHWSISGLEDLYSGELVGVLGRCDDPAIRPRAPAFASLMFEVLPGRVKGRMADGGWAIENHAPT